MKFGTLLILICVLLCFSVYLYRSEVMRMGNIRVYIRSVEQYLYRCGQALSALGGWGSQISRYSAHAGGKVVSPTHRPPLPPPPKRKYSLYLFLLEEGISYTLRSFVAYIGYLGVLLLDFNTKQITVGRTGTLDGVGRGCIQNSEGIGWFILNSEKRFCVYGSVHHNIFYEITNICSYMQSILFHC